MRILLVDHSCHKHTRSFAFLQRLLAERLSVEVFYYEKHNRCRIPKAVSDGADWIVFLEFLPWRFRLGVPGKKCLFVPMYDNEWGSIWQWRRIACSGMHVLSFSKHVTEHAKACGVANLLEVQYAVDPSRFVDMRGDPRRLLLWERGDVSVDTVKSLFAPEDLEEVLILRHPEDDLRHGEISAGDRALYHVRVAEVGFLPPDEYQELLRPCGLVLAPRFKEGIGMFFLEAMAMGKVVIAHDDATMNEAIKHGRNGWLADLRHPARVDASALRHIHATGFDRESAFRSWERDCKRIAAFLDAPEAAPMKSTANLGQALRFVLYLFEGAKMRLCGKKKTEGVPS